MVPAESNTATGLPVVSQATLHRVQMALQRKLRHPEVPRAGKPLDDHFDVVTRPPGHPVADELRLPVEAGLPDRAPELAQPVPNMIAFPGGKHTPSVRGLTVELAVPNVLVPQGSRSSYHGDKGVAWGMLLRTLAAVTAIPGGDAARPGDFCMCAVIA